MIQQNRIYQNRNKIQMGAFVIAVCICAFSFMTNNIPQIVFAVAFLWVISISFCLMNFAEMMLCFWMELTIGVFLIGRPLILTLGGDKWWDMDWLDIKDIVQALLIIALSLIAIYIGAGAAEIVYNKQQKRSTVTNEDEGKPFRKNLQAVSMVAFYVTAIFFMVVGAEKVLFCMTNSYLEYYTSFKSQLPWFVGTIGALMKYCLCIFLATKPRKQRAFPALVGFELSALFDLYVGIRGTIVLHTVFIVVYYLLRDIKKDSQKWFGKIEKMLVAIGTPIMMVFMVAYAYIRSGMRVLNFDFLGAIKDFFVSQGVTFEVVARGISVEMDLPQRAGRNYTFGNMIDYVLHGNLGQLLFGTQPLPEGNNIINGTESNSLAHNLSYLTRGDEYLQGKGWGSSYVLETYIDFHYIGVIIFSLLLGVMLVKAMQWYGEKILADIIILVSLLNIFYIPRAEATGWLLFIITLRFWICVGACYLGAHVVGRVSVLQEIVIKLKLFPNTDTCQRKKRCYTSFLERKCAKRGIVCLVCAVILLVSVAVYRNTRYELSGTVESNIADGAVYENRIVRLYARPEKSGEYLYQFSEVYNGKQKVVREYDQDKGYAFESSGIGEHVFYIDIKNSEGEKGTLIYNLVVREEP